MEMPHHCLFSVIQSCQFWRFRLADPVPREEEGGPIMIEREAASPPLSPSFSLSLPLCSGGGRAALRPQLSGGREGRGEAHPDKKKEGKMLDGNLGKKISEEEEEEGKRMALLAERKREIFNVRKCFFTVVRRASAPFSFSVPLFLRTWAFNSRWRLGETIRQEAEEKKVSRKIPS